MTCRACTASWDGTFIGLRFCICLFRNMLHRHDMLVFRGVEDRHPLRGTDGDADVANRAADELATVRYQHDFIALPDRERGHEIAVALVDDHGDDSLSSPPGHPVLVGR